MEKAKAVHKELPIFGASLFKPWTKERLEEEAGNFLAVMRKHTESFSLHEFRVLFKAYLIDGMLRGYIEHGLVKFYGIPEDSMIDEVVENVWKNVEEGLL